MYGKALVCARFRRRREQKTISISKAFSWFKMSQNDPFPTFAWKIPRNATFFALKTCSRWILGGKSKKWPKFWSNHPDTCEKVDTEMILTLSKIVFLDSISLQKKPSIWKVRKLQKSTFHLEGFFLVQMESQTGPSEKCPKGLQKSSNQSGFFSKSCKVRFLFEWHNFRKSHFPSRSLESLRDLLKSCQIWTKIPKTHLEGFLASEIYSKFDKSAGPAADNLKDP